MADQTSSSPFALPLGVATTSQQVLVVYTCYQYPSNTPGKSEMDRIHDHGVQAQHDHHIVAVDEPWSSQKELEESWFQSLKQRIESAPRRLRLPGPATIFRVPKNIRDINPEAYEPRMVSLGPYHRGKPHLKHVEELKMQYLRDFLSRNPEGGLEECYKRLKLVEAPARGAYSDKLKMKPNEFMEMLLLDGCFVVELFLKREAGGGTDCDDPFAGNEWALPLVIVDMLMLENQLPFFVLQLLYNMVTVKRSLAELAFLCLELDGSLQMNRHVVSSEASKFHHLLHLFHSSVLPVPAEDCSERRFPKLYQQLTYAKSFLSELRRRSSLSSFRKLRIPGLLRRRRRRSEDEDSSISCATKLKEAGIKFRRKTNTTSTFDVTFRDGCIEMPQMGVFDVTNYLLRNLIAFEQCFPDVGNHVATYAALMDCIVKTAGDVELLQSNKVILNALGDTTTAARLFNLLCKEVSADFDNTYLSGLVKDVNKHCSSKLNRWRAKLNHDYFNNPWSVVSVLGAIVLLFLTFVQTIFSVLSYLQQGH